MTQLFRYACIAALLSAASLPALAQDAKKAGDAARPGSVTANKPSESGAQSSMPSGAATGAGQPQGGAQPAQAQSAGSAKAKAEGASGSEVKAKKPVKKKKARKQRAAKNTTGTGDSPATVR